VSHEKMLMSVFIAVIYLVKKILERMVNQMAKRGENIYKRKDGRWEARAIKGYNEHGRAVYAYFYGRTYREAKDKMFTVLSYVDGSSALVPQKTESTLCFGALLDRWLDISKLRLKESSYVKYRNLIGKHIKPVLGDYTLSSINNSAVNKFIADKLKGNGTKGLSPKTVKDIVSVIKSALRFGKDESLINDFNINVVLPKEKPQNMRVLSMDEQAALEKFLCTDMDESKLGIYLCLYTGIRIGEACAIRWSDISLDDGTLTVSRTMQRVQKSEADSSEKTKIIITDPKSNFSVRTIPLPDCLLDKLKQFRPTLQDTYLLTGEARRFIEPRTFQYRFKSYLSKCGIKDANFHALRHTFATRCVSLGFEIKSLSEILGHANVNITLNRYVHPSFDMKRSNMNKLEALH